MKFVLQWHITEECNFRCKHCYQDKYISKWSDFEKLKSIFFEYLDIKENTFWCLFTERYINFVWWEPFLRKDFLDLLSFINDKTPSEINIWILTNWSLLNDIILEQIKKFQNLKVHFQISIEWNQNINDQIRWIWSYEKIIRAIKLCKNYWFDLHLSFTLTNLNKDELFTLIPLIEKYSLRIKVRRLVPIWFWNKISDFMLSAKDWYIFTIKIKKINLFLTNWFIDISGCSEVTWFEYNWDWCAINLHRLLVINHDLDVFPCKRLEISLWNLNNITLKDAFLSQEYKKLLDIHSEINTCKKCKLYNICKWWAKCITYWVYNKLTSPDPQCYKASLIK